MFGLSEHKNFMLFVIRAKNVQHSSKLWLYCEIIQRISDKEEAVNVSVNCHC